MGKKSIKENKTIYHMYREEAGHTRATASEALQFISESRLEKIENEKTPPHPEDILAMARVYNKPELCNIYCSQICLLGQEYIPSVECKDLSQITLEMIVTLNKLSSEKDRLAEILVDGKITPDELKDFKRINDDLDKMSLTIEALKLWVKKTIAANELDPSVLSE